MIQSWKTKNGYEIFQVLSGRSNSYFISTEKQNILVDTGKDSEYSRLKRNIDSLNIPDRKINFLILTHTHFDHCQNAAKIKEQEDCKIIVSEKEKESVEKGFTPLPNGTSIITKIISFTGNWIGRKRFGYKPFNPNICLDEEFDLLEYNLNIRLIKTDGHSAGSISIIVDHEIAIVGDALFGVFRNSVFPPFGDDQKAMVNSLRLLLDTGCDLFLPGHGKKVKRELLKREYNKYSSMHNKTSNLLTS